MRVFFRNHMDWLIVCFSAGWSLKTDLKATCSGELSLEQLINYLNLRVIPFCLFFVFSKPWLVCNAVERSRSWLNETLASFQNLTMRDKRVNPSLKALFRNYDDDRRFPIRDSTITIPEVTWDPSKLIYCGELPELSILTHHSLLVLSVQITY